MKILIIVSEMISLSGSPMYNYTLAMELKRQGNEVDIYSRFSNNTIRNNLINSGINAITQIPANKKYDLTLISQPLYTYLLKDIKTDMIINICHSEYDEESPIIGNRVCHYIAIRPSIKEHLVKSHNIREDNITVIYNGIDFNRFNKSKRKKHSGEYTKVVLPCSIHDFRLPFIKYYTDKASKDYKIYIYGHNFIRGFEKTINEYVFLSDAKFDIENYIYDADIVAGILYGRVNLEANAMGINTYIHNPLDPKDNYRYEIKNQEFNERHDIKNVAKQIIQLASKINIVIHETTPNKSKEIFANIYKNNLWTDKDSVSGTGSNLTQTKILISQLPLIFDRFNIKNLLDIPCGDFYWMQKVDLRKVHYIGADILEELIFKLVTSNNITFSVLDIINSKLPQVDLIFCRDCFVHFSYNDIITAIKNIKRSNSKYLLTTSFPNHKNTDIRTGLWRPIDLNKTPFNFPEPVFILKEGCTENNGAYNDKSMCLYEINKINI